MLRWPLLLAMVGIPSSLGAAQVQRAWTCNGDDPEKSNRPWCSFRYTVCLWKHRYITFPNSTSCSEATQAVPGSGCTWEGDKSELQDLRKYCMTSRNKFGYCDLRAALWQRRRRRPSPLCSGQRRITEIFYTCELKSVSAEKCNDLADNPGGRVTYDEAVETERTSDACHGSPIRDTTNYLWCEPGFRNICISEVRYYQHNQSSVCPRQTTTNRPPADSCCIRTKEQCHWTADTVEVRRLQHACDRNRRANGGCTLPAHGSKRAPPSGQCSGFSSVESIVYTCMQGSCRDTETPTGSTLKTPDTTAVLETPSNENETDASGDETIGVAVGLTVAGLTIITAVVTIAIIFWKKRKSFGKKELVTGNNDSITYYAAPAPYTDIPAHVSIDKHRTSEVVDSAHESPQYVELVGEEIASDHEGGPDYENTNNPGLYVNIPGERDANSEYEHLDHDDLQHDEGEYESLQDK